MRTRLQMTLLLLAGLLTVSVSPLLAHHGNASYENKEVTVKGTVTKWLWTNPHAFLLVDVTDDKGNVVHWDFETQSPSVLVHAGWTKNSLKPGDQVTIIATPAKDGAPVGLLSKVVLADGQELTDREK